MTVTYSAEVATSKLGTFMKLLLKWKGSIYRLLWKEFLIYASAFAFLSFMYRMILNPEQKKLFEHIGLYCNRYTELIPVAFVLGFYVSVVVTRWWDQLCLIPWPDRMALFVVNTIEGRSEKARLFRRSILRYLCLSLNLTFCSISPAAKKRFPTLEHLEVAGFLLKTERDLLEEIQTHHNKYFVPLVWAMTLLRRGRKEGLIEDDISLKTLVDEVNNFRGQVGTIFNYDWVNVPLVYTQVVTLAVHSFFIGCLMGRQFIVDELVGGIKIDPYVPFFTFLQFFFYVGWLKVAETLLNPFGEDDDDFDVNYLIDRNLQVSYLIVDDMHSERPQLEKDFHWNEIDFKLPYTAASKRFQGPIYLGSAIDINVNAKDAGLYVGREKKRQSEFIIYDRMVNEKDAIPLANSAPEKNNSPIYDIKSIPIPTPAPLGLVARVRRRISNSSRRKSSSSTNKVMGTVFQRSSSLISQKYPRKNGKSKESPHLNIGKIFPLTDDTEHSNYENETLPKRHTRKSNKKLQNNDIDDSTSNDTLNSSIAPSLISSEVILSSIYAGDLVTAQYKRSNAKKNQKPDQNENLVGGMNIEDLDSIYVKPETEGNPTLSKSEGSVPSHNSKRIINWLATNLDHKVKK